MMEQSYRALAPSSFVLRQAPNLVPRAAQAPCWQLRAEYKLDRTRNRLWRRTSYRRLRKCVPPAALILALQRVPPRVLRNLLSRLQPSFSGDKRIAERADLSLNLCRIGDGSGDLLAHYGQVVPAQAVDERLDRANADVQRLCSPFIRRFRSALPDSYEHLQDIKNGFFPSGNVCSAQDRHRVLQKRQRPAGLEDLFGRQKIYWFESITVLGCFQVEGNKLALAASLKSMRSLHLDRKIVLKAGQQERSELAFELVNLAQRPIFQNVQEKPLC